LSNLLKIGIPVIIVMLMLIVVGTGMVLARGGNTAVSTGPTISAGYPSSTWAGCWYNGSYCPGPCGRGGAYGNNPDNSTPSSNLPPCCRSY
jgi:hypothetical protein